MGGLKDIEGGSSSMESQSIPGPTLAHVIMEEDEDIAARAREKLSIDEKRWNQSLPWCFYVVLCLVFCAGLILVVYGIILVTRNRSNAGGT